MQLGGTREASSVKKKIRSLTKKARDLTSKGIKRKQKQDDQDLDAMRERMTTELQLIFRDCKYLFEHLQFDIEQLTNLGRLKDTWAHYTTKRSDQFRGIQNSIHITECEKSGDSGEGYSDTEENFTDDDDDSSSDSYF